MSFPKVLQSMKSTDFLLIIIDQKSFYNSFNMYTMATTKDFSYRPGENIPFILLLCVSSSEQMEF